MKRIKFFNEYHSWPLWHMDYKIDGEIGNIDPKSLPISIQLIEEIDKWSALYDATLNQEYPPESGFGDSYLAEIFLKTGHELIRRLQDELGLNYVIVNELSNEISDYIKTT